MTLWNIEEEEEEGGGKEEGMKKKERKKERKKDIRWTNEKYTKERGIVK